ncbi:MAG TPA: serine/threonine-protein phosphatase, partial [Candidatus Nocardiopsis merdipullorum]|nr:serine/threonine-protein phosphatase [Candidatus Nocardiopsis merdipullorum]
ILISERAQEEMYATLCMASLNTGSDQVRVRVLGHPPPLLVKGDTAEEAHITPQPPLGVFPVDEGVVDTFTLPKGTSVLFYTDGLVDAYDNDSSARLEVAGLRRLFVDLLERDVPFAQLPEHLVDEAERCNGGPLQDDVAILLINHGEPE